MSNQLWPNWVIFQIQHNLGKPCKFKTESDVINVINYEYHHNCINEGLCQSLCFIQINQSNVFINA